jgi:predicted RNA-binding protein with PUA-like domain
MGSTDRDTYACFRNTGMRNYVSRNVILDVQEGCLKLVWLVGKSTSRDSGGFDVMR